MNPKLRYRDASPTQEYINDMPASTRIQLNRANSEDRLAIDSMGSVSRKRKGIFTTNFLKKNQLPQLPNKYKINTDQKLDKTQENRQEKSKKKLQVTSKEKRQVTSKEKTKKRKGQQCPVCFSEFQKELLRQFSTCKHKFCTDCLEQHVQSSIKNFKPVQCLVEDCPIILDILSPHIKSLTTDQQQKYYKAIVSYNQSRNSKLKLCPTKDCDGFIDVELKVAVCAICQVVFCKECMMPTHKGSCDQNGISFLENQYKFRRCGKCPIVVQKNQGCNHMTCRCGYHFCYICGGKWSSNHKCNPARVVNAREQNTQRCCDRQNLKRKLKIILAIFLIFFLALFDITLGVFLLTVCPLLFLLSFMVWHTIDGFYYFKQHYTCVQICLGNIFLLLFCYGRVLCRQFPGSLGAICREAYRTNEYWFFPLSRKVWNKLT